MRTSIRTDVLAVVTDKGPHLAPSELPCPPGSLIWRRRSAALLLLLLLPPPPLQDQAVTQKHMSGALVADSTCGW